MSKVYIKKNSNFYEVNNFFIKTNGVWSSITQEQFLTYLRQTVSVFGGEITSARFEIAAPSTVAAETCQCLALYNDAALSTGVVWSVVSGSTYGSIDNTGLLTINSTANESEIVITATYGGKVATHTLTATYRSGSTSETTTEVIVDESGNSTTTITTVTENEDGSSYVEESVVIMDESGNTIGSSESTTNNNADGSYEISTVQYDENGDATSGTNVSGDTSGNVSTQDITYNANGEPVITGYEIDTTGMMKSDEFIETGFIPFDGSSDWELNFKFRWDWSRNTGEKSTTTSVLSCAEFVSGQLKSGFVLRFYAAKATSSATTPKTRPQLQVSVGDASTTKLLFVTGNSGRIYTNPVTYDVHIVKTGNTMNFEIQAIGSLKYNPTRDSTSTSNGCTTTQNEIVTYSWTDNSTSTVDITVGGYLNSQGSLAQKSDIDVYEFNVRKI